MKLLAVPAKPRGSYRIERSKMPEALEGDGHLWAVSYSDLLMVLLSFFILFFSIDEKQKDKVIHDMMPVANLLGGSAERSAAGGNGTSNLSSVGTPVSGAAVSGGDLRKTLGDIAGIELKPEGDSPNITLTFGRDIYPVGGVRLKLVDEQKLGLILDRLEPVLAKLKFEFIGHSDPTPVTNRAGRYMKDNFDLSANRGSQALRYALAHSGLGEDQVSAKGSGASSLGNRTLSIAITLRENQP